jgi:uncharacterized protein YggU (UPF0235/DUF167 family)
VAGDGAWRPVRDGLLVSFRLTPKSSRDEVGGLIDTADGKAIAAKVRAVPEKGAANTALERLVAEWLEVPKSTVTLDAGGKSRLKSLLVRGDPQSLEARIGARLSAVTERKK